MDMKKAQIIDGIVANIIEVDPANIPDWCADWPEATEEAEIGGTYEGGVFTPPPPYVPPPPTPEEIIAELKQFLRDTDYVALSDYDKDKPEILAQRQAWRDEIRELEA
jgi:hypothetical protein